MQSLHLSSSQIKRGAGGIFLRFLCMGQTWPSNKPGGVKHQVVPRAPPLFVSFIGDGNIVAWVKGLFLFLKIFFTWNLPKNPFTLQVLTQIMGKMPRGLIVLQATMHYVLFSNGIEQFNLKLELICGTSNQFDCHCICSKLKLCFCCLHLKWSVHAGDRSTQIPSTRNILFNSLGTL